MKKICWLLIAVMLLCGCSTEETLETVTDELLVSVISPQKELSVTLPATAARSVLSADDGAELYFCDGYVMTIQTTSAGDLNRTTRTLCGYAREALTVMETKLGGLKRYDWTWTSAGEGNVQVGRAAVLDDGDYHYCVTVMADEDGTGHLTKEWDALFTSLSLKR